MVGGWIVLCVEEGISEILREIVVICSVLMIGSFYVVRIFTMTVRV